MPLLRTHPIKCWLDTLFSRTWRSWLLRRPNTPTKGYGQCACMVCLYRIRAQPFLHILDFFTLYAIRLSKSDKGFPRMDALLPLFPPCAGGCIALHARTIAVFTHTIQFCCITFDNSMLLATLHTFYLYTQVMDLQRIKRKFAKFSSLMESGISLSHLLPKATKHQYVKVLLQVFEKFGS